MEKPNLLGCSPCDWVNSSRCFEGRCYFHFQGYEPVNHAVETSNHCFLILINTFISDVNYRSHLSCRVDAKVIFYERKKRHVSLYLDANLHEHIILLLKKFSENGNIVQYQMLVFRIIRIWLFPQQDLGVAVQVPPNMGDSIVVHCYCTCISNSIVTIVMKHPVVSKFELKGRIFLPRN
jgi:hypothetical protein